MASTVTLVGHAPPGTTVALAGTGRTATADSEGVLQFLQTPLALGTVLFYWYYSGSVRSSRSHLWFAVEQEVNNTNDPAKAMERLGTLAADHPGSMPGSRRWWPTGRAA